MIHHAASSHLVSLQQRVEYKSGVGQHVLWQRLDLLHGARVRFSGFAHVGHANVVTRSVNGTEGVVVADVCRWWMSEVVID